ncbi:D-aminoacyl-tRNA deacylase [Porcipelethomonas sp.]|uniref:D-aminoacyl-tRNA deacylase n=1 Tax=Porcipelethomonas sp. TaxID=2981675 RepID=UPI003EF92102
MRAVLQRVTHASVKVDGEVKGSIGKGLLVFLGVGLDDTEEDVKRLVNKIVRLRIFSDENDKINLSVNDVNGSLLVISQFTLYADCRKGNRPNFLNAGKPDEANRLYEFFTEECRNYVPVVEKGVFGADMKVELLNDGPFTIVLEDV